MDWILEHAYKERMKALTHCGEFQRIFGMPLKRFWIDNIMGFDIVAFDKAVGCPENMALGEYLPAKYGQRAFGLIKLLIK